MLSLAQVKFQEVLKLCKNQSIYCIQLDFPFQAERLQSFGQFVSLQNSIRLISTRIVYNRVIMQMDSSYSESDKDERYIKKDINVVVMGNDRIFGDSVSEDSKKSGEFKQLASNSEPSQLTVKSQDEQKYHLQGQQILPHLSSDNNMVLDELQVGNAVVQEEQPEKPYQQPAISEPKKDNEGGEAEQVQPGSQNLVKLDECDEEVGNKIEIDPEYLQYIRMQKEKRNPGNVNQAKEEEVVQLRKAQLQPIDQKAQEQAIEQKVQEIIELSQQPQIIEAAPQDVLKDSRSGKNEPNQSQKKQKFQQIQLKLIQNEQQQKINVKKQNEKLMDRQEHNQPIKKLKEGEMQVMGSAQNLMQMKKGIVREVKEELWGLKREQKVLQEKHEWILIQRLEQVQKDLIDEKINELNRQNSNQLSILVELSLKLLEQSRKFSARFQHLQQKIDKIANRNS